MQMDGPLWPLQFLLLIAASSVEASAVAMGDRTDIMGQYTLLNGVQCQRLCWYRKLCTAYSYNHKLTSGSNCVLHTDRLEGELLASLIHTKPPVHGSFNRVCVCVRA